MTETLPVDGRRLRSARSQAAVVDAFIELLRDGNPKPNVEDVASTSGVSVRSIFRHFDDLDSLHAAVVAASIERTLDAVPLDAPASGKAADRIAAVVDSRSKLFERLAPIAPLAASLAENELAASASARVSAALRAQAAVAFAAEVKKAGSEKKDALDAVEAAAGWTAWSNMRGSLGLGSARARRVAGRLVAGALNG